MIRKLFLTLALIATPLPVAAQPVAVRLIWDGNDSIGGVLVNRVRGLIAASTTSMRWSRSHPDWRSSSRR